ncbi:hypothetical protein C8R47DRAFT_1066189 [Mycena vitilis]|nr:hypothetical protein C8R47DRAFT_1066189 [Mycena vitilis]
MEPWSEFISGSRESADRSVLFEDEAMTSAQKTLYTMQAILQSQGEELLLCSGGRRTVDCGLDGREARGDTARNAGGSGLDPVACRLTLWDGEPWRSAPASVNPLDSYTTMPGPSEAGCILGLSVPWLDEAARLPRGSVTTTGFHRNTSQIQKICKKRDLDEALRSRQAPLNSGDGASRGGSGELKSKCGRDRHCSFELRGAGSATVGGRL